jgi:hypothetical protein
MSVVFQFKSMLCLSSNSWCDLMQIDVVLEFKCKVSLLSNHDRNTRNYVLILSTFRHSYKVYYHKYSLNNTINNYIQTQHEFKYMPCLYQVHIVLSNSCCVWVPFHVLFELLAFKFMLFEFQIILYDNANLCFIVLILSTFRHSYKVYYHKYSLNNTINNYIQTQHEIELKHNKNLNSNITKIFELK